MNSLAQTAIENYREILLHVFDIDIADRMNLILQPLGFGTALDPMEFLKRNRFKSKQSAAVTAMIERMNCAVESLEQQGIDTGSFMTVFRVRLESVKKVQNADFIVAVGGDANEPDAKLVKHRFDPNDPNWMREKELVALVTEIHGIPFTTYVFRALVWKYNLRTNERYCWESRERVLTKYSRETISFCQRCSKVELAQAIREYKQQLKSVRTGNKSKQMGARVRSTKELP